MDYETKGTKSFEELLFSRIGKAFEVMDIGDMVGYDDIIVSIKSLLKLVPDVYNRVQKWDEYYLKVVHSSYEVSKKKTSSIEDDYIRSLYEKRDRALIEWGYRKDILEAILNVLNDYRMIPFNSPVYAQIESAEIISEKTPKSAEAPTYETKEVAAPPVSELQKDIDATYARLKKEEEEIRKEAEERNKQQRRAR